MWIQHPPFTILPQHANMQHTPLSYDIVFHKDIMKLFGRENIEIKTFMRVFITLDPQQGMEG